MPKPSKAIRIDRDLYEAVRTLSGVEHRPIATQLRLLIEEGFESCGRTDILIAARAHRPMEGEEPFPELSPEITS